MKFVNIIEGVLNEKIFMSHQMIDTHLTQAKTSMIIQQIIRTVPELKDYYLTCNSAEKGAMLKHLKESYMHECQKANKIISVDEYINDIERTLGWDWVRPN
jgi:hypothetical protein